VRPAHHCCRKGSTLARFYGFNPLLFVHLVVSRATLVFTITTNAQGPQLVRTQKRGCPKKDILFLKEYLIRRFSICFLQPANLDHPLVATSDSFFREPTAAFSPWVGLGVTPLVGFPSFMGPATYVVCVHLLVPLPVPLLISLIYLCYPHSLDIFTAPGRRFSYELTNILTLGLYVAGRS